MKIINWERFFFVRRRIISAVKRVEFVSDRLSYIVLRGRWHNTIVVYVHAPSEEKSDESKNSFFRGIRAGVRSLPEISYENVTRRL